MVVPTLYVLRKVHLFIVFVTIFVEFKTSPERTFLKFFLGLLIGVGMHFGELLEEVSWR